MLTQEWFFLSFISHFRYLYLILLKIHSSLSIIDHWSSWKSCFLYLSLLNILLRFLILQRLDQLFSIRKPFGSFILRKIWVISKSTFHILEFEELYFLFLLSLFLWRIISLLFFLFRLGYLWGLFLHLGLFAINFIVIFFFVQQKVLSYFLFSKAYFLETAHFIGVGSWFLAYFLINSYSFLSGCTWSGFMPKFFM
jgi:hypothetical protein